MTRARIKSSNESSQNSSKKKCLKFQKEVLIALKTSFYSSENVFLALKRVLKLQKKFYSFKRSFTVGLDISDFILKKILTWSYQRH